MMNLLLLWLKSWMKLGIEVNPSESTFPCAGTRKKDPFSQRVKATPSLIGSGKGSPGKELPDLDCTIKGPVNYFEALLECFKGIFSRGGVALIKRLMFTARFKIFLSRNNERGGGLDM
ncbi:hypothetical protein TNIN_239691 [Trichonephila inaurata madagascariensis]|uniref:Uncharacterized protein n=1 Tax=Trichonephila inaurata madagascariensis TaxID=2747483 RepID=A0A8X7CFY8_9ARAC|nr:hypothetical protein TNIN_239691 [Trichonephila inaurata madagascariensis]